MYLEIEARTDWGIPFPQWVAHKQEMDVYVELLRIKYIIHSTFVIIVFRLLFLPE